MSGKLQVSKNLDLTAIEHCLELQPCHQQTFCLRQIGMRATASIQFSLSVASSQIRESNPQELIADAVSCIVTTECLCSYDDAVPHFSFFFSDPSLSLMNCLSVSLKSSKRSHCSM